MAQTAINQKCAAVIIGGSAGSLDVLLEVFPALKPHLGFPILLVIHRKSGSASVLINLLQSKTQLEVQEAEEKTILAPDTVYIAPADYHLLIEHNKMLSLDYSEKVNYSRPSIDVTFQSAADVFKDALVCILLSGSNADGVEGLIAVCNQGGMAVIQNPDTATMPYMPQQAVLNVNKHLILNSFEMADFINNLSHSSQKTD